MTRVKLNSKHYKIADTWADVTVLAAAQIARLTIPEKLRQYYEMRFKPLTKVEERCQFLERLLSEITDEEKYILHPGFCARVISALSDIPIQLLDGLHCEKAEGIFTKHFENFYIGICWQLFPPHEHCAAIQSFEFGGAVYRAPENISQRLIEQFSAHHYAYDYLAAAILLPEILLTDDPSKKQSFMGLPMNLYWGITSAILPDYIVQRNTVFNN